jgi:plastocyanin
MNSITRAFPKSKPALIAALLLATSCAGRVLAAPPASLIGEVTVPQGYPSRAGTVLWIDAPKGTPVPKPVTAEIDQKHMTFLPHVTVVPVGSTLVFRNSDPFMHQIRSQGGPLNGLHLDLKRKAPPAKVLVKESGTSELMCDIHADMSASVVALDTPYYAMSDDKGNFRFKELPKAYPWSLHVWHEVLPPQDFKIENDKDLEKLKHITLKTWEK